MYARQGRIKYYLYYGTVGTPSTCTLVHPWVEY